MRALLRTIADGRAPAALGMHAGSLVQFGGVRGPAAMQGTSLAPLVASAEARGPGEIVGELDDVGAGRVLGYVE